MLPHWSLPPIGPLCHLLLGVKEALVRLPARITDQSGAAADEHDGAMASELDSSEREERQEASDVEAVRRRVEAAVDRAGRLRQVRVQLARAGRVRDQPTPFEVVEQRRSRARFHLIPRRSVPFYDERATPRHARGRSDAHGRPPRYNVADGRPNPPFPDEPASSAPPRLRPEAPPPELQPLPSPACRLLLAKRKR